jgi:hypothetical protein
MSQLASRRLHAERQLLNTIRGRVVALLQRGRLAVDDIAAELQLTCNAVRVTSHPWSETEWFSAWDIDRARTKVLFVAKGS